MTQIKAKYPIKIGKNLIDKGELGRVASLEEAKVQFPLIEYNLNSSFVSVIFRDYSPCIVNKSQIEFI